MPATIHAIESATMDDIYNLSESSKISLQQAAATLKSPHISKPLIWPEPVDYEPSISKTPVDLCNSKRGDIITEYAKMVSNYIQFPTSTAFLHCLGCVSAAMTRNFKVQYGASDMYANLYIVTAQPPSTGKSAINDFCFSPVFEAYVEHNHRNQRERTMLEVEIKNLESELGNKKNDEYDLAELVDKIDSKKRRLRHVAYIRPTITNATIEALERETGKQGGMFNIVSDEADSINIVLGAVYSDEKNSTKSNSELILKGWDNGHVSSTRIGRDGLDGRARGAIVVLAQADSVDTILAAGASGRGIAERFFLLNEPSLLGDRNRKQRSKFDGSLKRRYENMIKNIVEHDEVLLTFTPAAEDVFLNYEISIEQKLSETGEYSHNLFTGFMGKAAKQCRKLAAVLHTAQAWQDGESHSTTISDDVALWAVAIFDELGKTFRAASDSLGHVGEHSEINKLITVIIRNAEKGRLKMSIPALRDSIKNSKPFSGSRNLQRKLKEQVLPALERLNYLVVDGNTIHINPRLK